MAPQLWHAASLALVALSAALPSQDANSTENRLARCVAQHAETNDADAFAIRVQIGEEALLATGHGRAAARSNRDAGEDTVFPAGELAHAWLATALLAKASSGDLDLEVRVQSLVPELVPKDSPVRVHDLLRHTSGLADYRDHAPERLLLQAPSYAEVMATLKDVAPVNPPGECVAECATDTLLLAAVVEAQYGAPADEALHRAIFGPLEMRSTGYQMTAVAREAGADEPASPAFLPDGLRSSAGDLALFSRGLVDRIVLDSAAVEELTQPVRLSDGTLSSTGMGVRLVELGDEPGHFLGGSSAVIAHFPAHDLVIAAIGEGDEPMLDELAWRVAQTVAAPPEVELRDLPLTEEEQAPYLGSYQIGCTTILIASDGARLVLDEVDRGKTLLLNQGEHVFLARDGSDVRLEFQLVGEQAESFALIRNGLRSTAQRLGRDG